MHRFLALACVVSAITFRCETVSADETLMPDRVAKRLGLVEAWQRGISAPNGAVSIADQQIFVHRNNPQVYVEIVTAGKAPADTKKPADAEAATSADAGDTATAAAAAAQDDVLMRITVNTADAAGNSIDLKEAERLASNEIRRLKRRGVTATMRTTEVPRVVIYSIADDGGLEARDAETGRAIWNTHVGQRGLHFGQLGVSEEFVTVMNGANLIQVNAANGDTTTEMRTLNAPQFGAINSGDFAMVVTIGGGLECYPLTDPSLDPFREIVDGRALASPTKSPSSSRTAWATDRSLVYVMELLGKPSTLFRLDTDGMITGRIAAASNDRFFFGSDAGQVYAIRATRSGIVSWVTPFGEPFYAEPLVVEDQVMLVSTYGRVFSMNVETGDLSWDAPATNIARLIGGFGDHVYAVTMGGSLTVLDRKTGNTVSTFTEVRPARELTNRETNRLYLVSDSGAVQCLRPLNSKLPKFNTTPDPKPIVEAEEEKVEEKESSSPFDAGGMNPFGAGGDPFGAGGASGDPFGGGGDAMADPFGADPFGN
ncbi:outer membrane biogenesis protein BamB [Rubripirellula tenax]|uniref:Outer membrane biogenesis protein BamB n=1 Tax=Rubripirellula tenax TaxID=2528015 RepID=A0A5C6FJ59_9BACT|nr:PQQ-binding-like beta-propeller repeat protein [Rubripirellula tenax]TWU60089.1 outer membrane biogenesis protein BamB [Rubripirellula tenax]